MERGVLAIWNDCGENREEEYETWYLGEHFFERISIPGFHYGRRYEAMEDGPRYFTHYITETPDILTSEAYQLRLDNPTKMTRAVMSGVMINVNRTVCRQVAVEGQLRGAYVSTFRFRIPQSHPPFLACIEECLSSPFVVHAEAWVAADVEKEELSKEEAIRGADGTISGCLMIEATVESAIRMITKQIAEKITDDAEVGFYQLICTLENKNIW